MNKQEFNLDAYMQRIGFKGKIQTTLETLFALHHAQLYSIPFENFDIQLNRDISLDTKAILKKLVFKKRGGYCFELNGLFLTALESIGFDARALLARVHITGDPTGRGHQLELITIDGKQWIADVGFGADTPRKPIPLELDQAMNHDGQTVRLVKNDRYGIMLQCLKEESWVDLYSFDLGHVCTADISYGHHFTSTHPSSLFVLSRVAALPIENGVVTLINSTLKEVIAGKEKCQDLAEGQAYLDALKKYFGIELEVPYDQLKPLA